MAQINFSNRDPLPRAPVNPAAAATPAGIPDASRAMPGAPRLANLGMENRSLRMLQFHAYPSQEPHPGSVAEAPQRAAVQSELQHTIIRRTLARIDHDYRDLKQKCSVVLEALNQLTDRDTRIFSQGLACAMMRMDDKHRALGRYHIDPPTHIDASLPRKLQALQTSLDQLRKLCRHKLANHPDLHWDVQNLGKISAQLDQFIQRKMEGIDLFDEIPRAPRAPAITTATRKRARSESPPPVLAQLAPVTAPTLTATMAPASTDASVCGHAAPQTRIVQEAVESLRRQTRQVHDRLGAASSQLSQQADDYHKWLSQQLRQAGANLKLVESSYALLTSQVQDRAFSPALLDRIQHQYSLAEEDIQYFLPYCERRIRHSARLPSISEILSQNGPQTPPSDAMATPGLPGVSAGAALTHY